LELLKINSILFRKIYESQYFSPYKNQKKSKKMTTKTVIEQKAGLSGEKSASGKCVYSEIEEESNR
jgi:hypothetical protein